MPNITVVAVRDLVTHVVICGVILYLETISDCPRIRQGGVRDGLSH